MNALISPPMGKIISLLFFYKGDFSINYTTKVNMVLRQRTEKVVIYKYKLVNSSTVDPCTFINPAKILFTPGVYRGYFEILYSTPTPEIFL